MFSMDWTLQNSARTNGMGRMNSGGRRCANILRSHGRSETLRGTSIVVSTRAPSTFAHTDLVRSQQPTGSAHHTESVSTMDIDVRASNTYDQSEDIVVKTDTVPASTCKVHIINEIRLLY